MSLNNELLKDRFILSVPKNAIITRRMPKTSKNLLITLLRGFNIISEN